MFKSESKKYGIKVIRYIEIQCSKIRYKEIQCVQIIRNKEYRVLKSYIKKYSVFKSEIKKYSVFSSSDKIAGICSLLLFLITFTIVFTLQCHSCRSFHY